MKKVLIRCLLVVLAATGAAQVQRKPAPRSNKVPESCVRVQDGAFHSAALDREMKYRILLPCGYQSGSGRFPVLYLLHGLYGDYLNWDTRTNLERCAQRYELIVVMPDAGDSWYTNSATDPKDKFEDYIAKDLVAEIDGKFRTLRFSPFESNCRPFDGRIRSSENRASVSRRLCLRRQSQRCTRRTTGSG